MQVSITPSEQAFLNHIAENGPTTAYDLGNATNYSEKTAYQSTKSLVEKKMLKPRVIGKTRAGLDKKEYDLTVLGLVFVLADLADATNEDIFSIAQHWSDLLPLVLGKWDFFIEEGIDEWTLGNLLGSARHFIYILNMNRDELSPLGFNLYTSSDIVKELKTRVLVATKKQMTDLFLKMGIGKTDDEFKKLLRCAKDPDIKERLLDLHRQREQAEELAKIFERARGMKRMLEEKKEDMRA